MDEPELIDDGPVLRPYALVRGRTPPSAKAFDLLSVVAATGTPVPPNADLGPEHLRLLALVRRARPVVEVASDVDLPIGVIRLLLDDLLTLGLILNRPPAPVATTPHVTLLQEVLKGLQSL
ncbi:DUF742 domain-containing protein [Sphaerisporangium corydalis]|uniref:DUF742 domain-containing protein n=1 Tax=Sphaerisporangium corydalis TaxID=1441875 RepID=A0ABV9ERQ1_9ACTN|nr:DUF742 domain-containing protein [Sphaerisporangium corydalis]